MNLKRNKVTIQFLKDHHLMSAENSGGNIFRKGEIREYLIREQLLVCKYENQDNSYYRLPLDDILIKRVAKIVKPQDIEPAPQKTDKELLSEKFYEAWWFLSEHKMFYVPRFDDIYFDGALTMEVVKVNPKTNSIDDDDCLNTKVQIWLECGPYDNEIEQFTHDIELDCGADTFEEAVIELAKLVKKHYKK